jgi:hypothetical protein
MNVGRPWGDVGNPRNMWVLIALEGAEDSFDGASAASTRLTGGTHLGARHQAVTTSADSGGRRFV